MKKLTLLIALAFTIQATAFSQPCLPEGIEFTTQAQIDSFQINYPNCTEIEGDVFIGEWPGLDITNLIGLTGLTSIGGELYIQYNQHLPNLSGLSNLTSIGDDLTISRNDSLSNLTGLENLTFVNGMITISRNGFLSSLTGLEGLISIESLSISNPLLTSLEGLNNIVNIDGHLEIAGNDTLQSLSGLESLTTVGGMLEITSNDNLQSLSGLENLASLGGNLIIGDYERYMEFWSCRGNSSLNDLSSLSNLTSITGDLYVICNTSLTDLYGLHNITCVGGDLIISSNDSLVNLISLSQLDTIHGNLEIGVTGDGWVLWKYGNPSITDLSGLDNLDYIGGNVNILGNDSLNSLSGLNTLSEGSIMNLSIIHNANLSDCEAQSICSYLASPNGIVEIRNNAPGCNNPVEAASGCGFSMPCLPYGNYFLLSQADVDNFQNDYQGCTDLEGNVIISGDDITNLHGLNGVTSLAGSLEFGDWIFGGNPLLTKLEGLEGLNSIGNDLRIYKTSLFDLTGLNNLGSIGGELRVESNSVLTNLSALNNLVSIGGNLSVSGNSVLTNLSGLENFDSIGGHLSIGGNHSLTTLTELDNLVSIGGGLWITMNDSLTSLSGLDNLVSIGGRLWITFNDSLTSLSGLDNIDANSINELAIHNNSELSDCEVKSVCDYLAASNGWVKIEMNAPGCISKAEVEKACESACLPEGITFTTQPQIDSFQINYPNCNEIEGFVKIYGDDITNLNGLNNLTSIGTILEIGSYDGGCPSLANLSGLENLNSVRALEIRNNESLLNITGLKNIHSIKRQVYIFNNDALTNLSGLEGLETIGGGVSIIDNDVLVNLEGLNNLDSILAIMYGGGNLIIENNKALINLKGLENLKFLADGIDDYESRISIDGNEALVSLEGIEKVEAENVQLLFIKNNPSLSVCDAEWVCKILSDTTTGIFIENNASGCNSQQEVLSTCDFPSVTEYGLIQAISINPNPFSASTTIAYQLQQPTITQIFIYNHLGKQVEKIENKQSQGKQQVVWNAEGQPAGIYFCVIKTEGGSKAMKMIKLK